MARILLAEDDTSMREYLQRALQRVGYEVEAVGCGTEAMPLLETERFDLLLTDVIITDDLFKLNRTTQHSYTQAASCESTVSELAAVLRASTAAVTSGV